MERPTPNPPLLRTGSAVASVQRPTPNWGDSPSRSAYYVRQRIVLKIFVPQLRGYDVTGGRSFSPFPCVHSHFKA